MSIDVSTAISICAVLFSLCSAVAAPVITGHYRLKEKKLELRAEARRRQKEYYEAHRAEVIERYISAAGYACQSPSDGNASFGAVQNEIYLYVDESLWPKLDEIALRLKRDSALTDEERRYLKASGNSAPPFSELTELCKALAVSGVRTKD